MAVRVLLLWVFVVSFAVSVSAEDGSSLWLRYQSTGAKADIKCEKQSPTLNIAVSELQKFWEGGMPVMLEIRKDKEWRKLGKEGYTIRTSGSGEGNRITIASYGEQGILYGAYHLLRLQAAGQLSSSADLKELNIAECPQNEIRILNHWDNLNGTIERGYAGHSLWKWEELPDVVSSRYEAYARANASIGINATVLNNVNASPEMLSEAYLRKVKVLADIFRPYGLKVYLSVNFSSPAVLGGLPTSDPLDKRVIAWWKEKAKFIYQLMPDFGGFLVKANSEGQSGPCDYGRTHAEGANMLADVLKPYKGIVMWRAFVYNPTEEDRAKQAFSEFYPLDGQFRENVIIQVKNGPIDFQPREPYHPLFTAMRDSRLMVEFQLTQEYLGFSNHLVYLAPMWKEFFSFVPSGTLKAIAGVANIGEDTNWCGHHFAQANLYAFGRMAWNPSLSPEEIAGEWLKQTFTSEDAFLAPVKEMMMESREAAVNYMMPLGLHHIFAGEHHYGPEPWYDVPGARRDWMPPYYHQADKMGIGFDRSKRGSDAVAQYPDSLCRLYGNVSTCPEKYLLWFHHLPWTHRMQSGRTLWDELCYAYDEGVRQARSFQKIWDKAEPYVDARRFKEVQAKLRIQSRDAVWWKDACLLYFQTFSQRPIPYELERPVHSLEDMMNFKLKISMYECPPAGFSK